MTQFNITISGELLHGLFLSNGKDEAFAKLLEGIHREELETGI
jgi:putative transposase